ncbi:OmpA family protein [Thioclava sp. GXIMD4216]|uniref:OmpA family protein n=1 Tax=Thioclava litoralis TaxID=3076557 RepID=A0ABZ1E0J0_9RHOB|nr:OmpA family protein [Thioclava sp. FTW29]
MRSKILTATAFGAALLCSALVAGGSATVIEKRTKSDIRIALETSGHGWAKIDTDGLQVLVSGTAPSEAERLRTMTVISSVVEASRIRDNTDVVQTEDLTAPDFSLEILRNDDGVSLIGLVPSTTDRKALMSTVASFTQGGEVVDMLDVADYPVPKGWNTAYNFAVETLRTLPHSKISVEAGKVSVTAITASKREKSDIETALNRRKPDGLDLSYNISAPRPVITPFTLRFIKDDEGARFDACSADTDRAKTTILAAARKAGAEGDLGCTVGMGVPSTEWADAAAMGIAAIGQMGAGTITYSDTDIALDVPASVGNDAFDQAVADLETNLPDVFSLHSIHEQPKQVQAQIAQFSAARDASGKVVLRGRVTNAMQRDMVENYARAQFGSKDVSGATRVDDSLPADWGVRMMAGLAALDQLNSGQITVRPDILRVSGISGNAQASDEISRLLSKRLGEAARIDLSVRYDRRLDPVLGLPSGQECVTRLNNVLSAQKITFEPGSAKIDAAGETPVEALAKAYHNCEDYKLEIDGHTDSQGRDEMNMALSRDRANAVLEALAARGVPVRNLTAKGYGETQPIADNGTEAGREANRRIEFVLLDEQPLETGEPLPEATASATTPIVEEASKGEAQADQVGGTADTSSDAAQDPQITIPVAPAAKSPGKPKLRPADLKTSKN